MKRLTHILTCFAAALMLFTACEDDPKLTSLQPVSFSDSPEASTSAVVLTEDNLVENVISFSWPKVEYPVDAPVTYTLQFASPADTIGENAWANVIEKEIGDDVYSGPLSGEELNGIAESLGIEPETEGTIVVRVKSYMDREAYSSALAVAVTPYKVFTGYPTLWIAGDFQGWNIGAAATMVSVNDDGVYEGYIYIPAGGTNEFKLYAQPDWGPTSYGDGGNGTVIVANYAGANFKAPSDGYYLFSVDLNNMTYLMMKTSWGLIGGATPGGWDADTQMNYNAATQVWSVTADMKKDGSFKFRANNAWQLDFGIDENAALAYANHPWKAYVDRPQLTVPSDGNYTITLDLHDPGNYTYTINKN